MRRLPTLLALGVVLALLAALLAMPPIGATAHPATDAPGTVAPGAGPATGVDSAETDPTGADSTGTDRRIVPLSSTNDEPGLRPDVDVTGAGVTVAVIDTGIDTSHPDLEDRVVDRVDLVGDGEAVDGAGGGATDESEYSVIDGSGHGTHVASVLAGTGAASDGQYTGVAPEASIVDVRALDEHGSGHAETLVDGIEYAVEEAEVDVIALSLGYRGEGSEAIAEAVRWANDQGIVVVASAGNVGDARSISTPGQTPGAITVGAVDDEGSIAPYSSRGPTIGGALKPDLVAPGASVPGARAAGIGNAIDDDGYYRTRSGTSAAAPQVAGTVALLLETDPTLTSDEIRARLTSTARPTEAHAYEQGSGVLQIERALDPDVVADDATVDFGVLDDDERRTIVFENHDDRTHEITLESELRNVDTDAEVGDHLSVNRSDLSLAPGDRAAVELSVDGNATLGAHAGALRYEVDGTPRSVAIGFVRGGVVTVEKRPLSDDGRVDGDDLQVFAEDGTHEQVMSFEDGTASFVATGGPYVLWSWGTDEESGALVLLSKRITATESTRVVLDEADTVPFGVDTSALVERYGPLANVSVTASMVAPFGDDTNWFARPVENADSREIRVSPDPEQTVAATYVLVPAHDRDAPLDTADVFQLGHAATGIEGPETATVEPWQLDTVVRAYPRTTVDRTYRVRDRIDLDGVWNYRPQQWFDLGPRTAQRIHRFPADATYDRIVDGDGWRFERTERGEGALRAATVLDHPLHGTVDVRAEDGVVSASAVPFADSAGSRVATGNGTISVLVDGDRVAREWIEHDGGTIDDVAVGSERVAVRLEGENPDGVLSTRTLTEVVLDADGGVQENPAAIDGLQIREADATGAVEPGTATVEVGVATPGRVVGTSIWYAYGQPDSPPWVDPAGWNRAETSRDDGRLLGSFDVEPAAEPVSVAAELPTFDGTTTRTMTVNAFHAGSAPDTSTRLIEGQLLDAAGEQAINDTVVAEPVEDPSVPTWRRDPGEPITAQTDDRGRFELDVPKGERYDLRYERGEATDRPAVLALDRITVDDEDVTYDRTLPAGTRFVPNVTDERGEPVSNATVRLEHRSGNASVERTLETHGNGTIVGPTGPGLLLGDEISYTVEPPADGPYTEQSHSGTLDMTGDRIDEPVVLETTPPAATLEANLRGLYENMTLRLDAGESDVPAGVAEYRWDLRGDGTVDEVTDDPIVRFQPEAGHIEPTVTVVDDAGKRDSASVSVRVVERD